MGMMKEFLSEDYPSFHRCPFFLVVSLINFPKLHVWDISLFASTQNCMPPLFTCNSTGEIFLCLLPLRDSAMFYLFRLSNTLSELWVSNSHTSWHWGTRY